MALGPEKPNPMSRFRSISEPFRLYDEACSTQMPMPERKYLPTKADLIDRLSICLLKYIRLGGPAYRAEMADIKHDLLLLETDPDLIYAVMVLMLSNAEIWNNEAIARSRGKGGKLRFTHSLNGVRTRAKNEISKMYGERTDAKVDCLAADLPGNWDVFDEGLAPTSAG